MTSADRDVDYLGERQLSAGFAGVVELLSAAGGELLLVGASTLRNDLVAARRGEGVARAPQGCMGALDVERSLAGRSDSVAWSQAV